MKLLLIDEDQASSRWLAERLESLGFVPRTSSSLELALREKLFGHVRAILAGVGSSETEGRVFTRRVRQAGFEQPLMILSARDDWRDSIACLDAGADDYLAKPVRSEEVASRLRAIIRRGSGSSTDRIALDDLELDLKARCAWLAGECLDLTRNEFRLLSLFVLEPESVMTHRDIYLRLCPEGSEISQNAIEVQIARLRRKVGKGRIRTVRGVGYRFAYEEQCRKPTQTAEGQTSKAATCEPCQKRQNSDSSDLPLPDSEGPHANLPFGSVAA